jgi:hypothetical protein
MEQHRNAIALEQQREQRGEIRQSPRAIVCWQQDRARSVGWRLEGRHAIAECGHEARQLRDRLAFDLIREQ